MIKQQTQTDIDNENINPHLSHFIENVTESEHNYPDTFINNSTHSNPQILPATKTKHSKHKCSDVLKNLQWQSQSPNTNNNTNIESVESIFNYSNKHKHKHKTNNSNISPQLANQKELSMLSSISNNKRPHSSNILPKYKHKSHSNNNNNEQSSIMDIPVSTLKRNTRYRRHSQINLKAKYIITLEQNFNIQGISPEQQEEQNTKVKKKKHHHKHKHKRHNKENNFDLSDSEISDINLSAISQLKRDITNKRKSQKTNDHKCNTNLSLNVSVTCNNKLKLEVIQCIKKSKSMIDKVGWSRNDNDNTFLDNSTLLIMKDLDSGKKQNKKDLNEKLLLKKKKVIKTNTKNKNSVNNSNKIGSSSNNKSKSILKQGKDGTNKGNVVLQYNEEKTKSKIKQNNTKIKNKSNSNSKITNKSKNSNNNTNRSNSNNNIRNKTNRLTLNADKPKQTLSPNASPKSSRSPRNEINKQNNNNNNTNKANNANNTKHSKVHQAKLPKCKGKNTPIKNNNNTNNNNTNNNNSQSQQHKIILSSKNPLPNIPKLQTKISPIQLKNTHHVHSQSFKHLLHNNNTNTNNNLLHSSPTQILDESQCKRITRDRSHRQPFSGISQEYIDKKRQFFMDLMRDPSNPYSLYWSNKMLSKGFGVTTNVKGTLNCVPNLGLINFNNSHSQLPHTNSTIYSPEELSNINKIKRFQYEHLKHNDNNDKSLSHNASTFYNVSKYYIPKTTDRTSSCKTKLKLVQYPSIYKYFQ